MKYKASNQITKNAILESFMTLLTRKNLDEITIGEITESVGLSRKTFYYHFVDINDLIIWTFNQQIQAALKNSDAAQNKQAGLKQFLYELEKRKKLFASIFNSKYSKIIRNGFMDITTASVADVMKNVPKVSGADNDVLYQMFAIAIVSLLENWVCDRLALSADEMMEYINMLIAIVFFGIEDLNEGLRQNLFDLPGLEKMLGTLDYSSGD